jgi:hypothetical protein
MSIVTENNDRKAADSSPPRVTEGLHVRDDGIDFSDALILAGLAYMWLSDGSESYSSRESYDQSTPAVDAEPDYTSSYSSSDSGGSDYSSSSSDYSSSSYDSGGSFSSSD